MKIRTAPQADSGKVASPKRVDPQLHPQANIVLICLGLAFVLGITGTQIAVHTSYTRVSFCLGVCTGAAFAVAMVLMICSVSSYKNER